jgi:hypothetical protein
MADDYLEGVRCRLKADGCTCWENRTSDSRTFEFVAARSGFTPGILATL